MSLPTKLKQALTSNWLLLIIVGGLYITGLHTPVIAFLQRGILATGIMQPDTDLPVAPDRSGPASTEHLAFIMVDPSGQEVDARDLAGKVVFINLWASWCAPCLAEMPNIAALWKDYATDERVAFVLLNVENDFTKGRDYVGNKGYGFPIYHLRGALPAGMFSGTLPSTYVIGPNGEMVVEHTGMASYDTRKFRALLDGLAARVEANK